VHQLRCESAHATQPITQPEPWDVLPPSEKLRLTLDLTCADSLC
jgi:hypothetical protein